MAARIYVLFHDCPAIVSNSVQFGQQFREQARVENGLLRYKSVLGAGLKARNSKAPRKETMIGCHILNRMAELGKPESYAVAS